MIKRITGVAALVLAAAGSFGVQPAQAAEAATKCHMTFSTSGWAAIYKRLDGQGHVRCDNGQSATVMIHVRGGGLTAGKYSIENGKGEFTNVKSIDEIFGDYATAGANAGAVKSAESVAMTKGEVSLAITGTGRGFNLGVDVTRFEISRK